MKKLSSLERKLILINLGMDIESYEEVKRNRKLFVISFTVGLILGAALVWTFVK